GRPSGRATLRESVRSPPADHCTEYGRPAPPRLREWRAPPDPPGSPTALPVQAECLPGCRAAPRSGGADERSASDAPLQRDEPARNRRMSAVRTGVIGVGALGFHHARILRELDGSTLVGVHDSDPVRLAEVGASLNVPTFADAGELLDQVDACVIAVPT